MDKKLKPSPFKVKAIPFIFIIATFPILFSCDPYRVIERVPSAEISPFIKKFITQHTTQIGESEQLIFATNRDAHRFASRFMPWREAMVSGTSSSRHLLDRLERKGLLLLTIREGDGKSPAAFSL